MISDCTRPPTIYFSYSTGPNYSNSRGSWRAMSDVMTAMFPERIWSLSPLLLLPSVDENGSVAVGRLWRYQLQRSLEAFPDADWAVAGNWKDPGPMVIMGRVEDPPDQTAWETCPTDYWLGYLGDVEEDRVAACLREALGLFDPNEDRTPGNEGPQVARLTEALLRCRLPAVIFPVGRRSPQWYPSGWRCECAAFLVDSPDFCSGVRLPTDGLIQGVAEFHVATPIA